MSHYIVLVKQVPDVTQITDNAFDPETGNLMRGKLATVINELDAQALAFADRMRQLDTTSDGKVIALTMGPPMAEDVLRYSLARRADIAVLLTDRSLGGADTVATANPLAYAVRKIVKDLLGDTKDYFVVSGMQSVDGDTAQVPAQISEELALPCIAYATDVERKNGHLEFTRIISGGSQIVTPKALPAVITVAKYEYPLFATFAGGRRANDMKLVVWGTDDIKPTSIGVKGSKTRVIRVFPPPHTSRKCQAIENVGEFAQLFIDSYKSNQGNGEVDDKTKANYVLPGKRTGKFDRNYEGTKKECEAFINLAEKLESLGIKDSADVDEAIKEKILADIDTKLNKRTLDNLLSGMQAVKPSYSGDVWVIAEHDGSQMHPATFELIGKARDLADSLEIKVGVVIAGEKVEPMAKALIEAGADKIYVIEDKLLEPFDPAAHRTVIAEVVKKHRPQIALYAATPRGRVLAPMVSYRLGCGLTADCTSLDIRDSSRKGDIAVLMQTRPALGGNVMATICTKDSNCQMATARPGVMKRLPPDKSRKGSIIRHEVKLAKGDLSMNIIKTEVGLGTVNFDADVIVSGGKGISSKDSFEKCTSDLCKALADKLNAEVEYGASRAAVEQGYVERVHQVGQTGTAVGPRIYLAMGISGAIQHMIGVANSETIFAINSDPNAPILKQCDYYIVGNVEDIVPQLVETLGAK